MKNDKIITLSNGEKYLIMATTEYQNQKYYYLIQTNENTTDIVDNIKIAKENNSNIIFINNINEIFAVLKLFKIEEV